MFTICFAVTDPLGTVPAFNAVTLKYDDAETRKIAVQATIISALILIFFVMAGEAILNAIHSRYHY
jgi:multiple antibiotic resistance protein